MFDPSKVPAISIKQPWGAYILLDEDPKDIENRTWKTNYRGWVLMHAGKKSDDPEFCKDAELPMGGIVGAMNIVDCVDQSESKWWQGPYGFVIQEAFALPFIPCRGQLNFFSPKMSADDMQTIRLEIARYRDQRQHAA